MRSAHRRVVPLWLHQVAEYVVGLALAEMALHVRGQMETALLAGAGAMVAVGLLTDGPIGALRLLGPRAHQVADVGLAVGLAASPLAVPGHLDPLAIVTAEAVAGLYLRMATLTRYPARHRPPAGAQTATGSPLAQTLGFLAGRARREGLRQAPRAERAVAAGARRLGTYLAKRGLRSGGGGAGGGG